MKGAHCKPLFSFSFSSVRYEDVVELLLKHGARVDVEARMCWPGPHQQNCEERGKNARKRDDGGAFYRSSDKLQCAIYYAIDGDQVIRSCCLPSNLVEFVPSLL